jgi:aryl-alcohol dehydrogenase-like predicted oxidoreductase
VRYRSTRDGRLRVSEIGVGTYAIAGVYGRKDVDSIKQVLRKAYDRGVTMFDTAPVYGNAEAVLHEVLGDVRKDIVISTKVPAGVKGSSCSYKTITESCDESLRRLGTDYVDLYQIHFDDGKTPVEEVVRAFDDLVEKGKIRAYGIGHVPAGRSREYVAKGSISTIMGELSAVSRSYYLRMLSLVKGDGPGYIGFSLTGRGILTGAVKGRDGLVESDIRQMDALFAGERLHSALRVREEFGKLGREVGATPAQVAICWALGQEGVVTGLVGPSSLEHLEENLGASELDVSSQVMDRLDAFLAKERERLREAVRREMVSILENEIADLRTGAQALVYVIEGLDDLDLAPLEDLLPMIRSVIKILKTGEGDIASLEKVRKDLLGYVGSA